MVYALYGISKIANTIETAVAIAFIAALIQNLIKCGAYSSNHGIVEKYCINIAKKFRIVFEKEFRQVRCPPL